MIIMPTPAITAQKLNHPAPNTFAALFCCVTTVEAEGAEVPPAFEAVA